MAYAIVPTNCRHPLNEYQVTTLRKRSIEAFQPKLFAEDLTSK
jgi:hypothetical protein